MYRKPHGNIPPPVVSLLAALVVILFTWSCGSGDRPLAKIDPSAVPDSTTFEQLFNIIQRECLPCHDEGGTEPRFDTCEHVVENSGALFEQVIVENAMPPGAWPRLTSEEKLVIQRWDGGAPCTP